MELLLLIPMLLFLVPVVLFILLFAKINLLNNRLSSLEQRIAVLAPEEKPRRQSEAQVVNRVGERAAAAEANSAPPHFISTETKQRQQIAEKPPVTLPAQTPSPQTCAGLFARLWRKACSFFSGANSIARVGILILFLGLAFLLKYAAESGYLPIELRLLGVAGAAILLFITGIYLQRKRPVYALTLEGGSLAILYLVIFAGFYHYRILPAGFALTLLITITFFAFIWSIRQNARFFAVFGTAGGFLAPLLISTDTKDVTLLFSYYLLLNLLIFMTAWFRAWRELNLLGFLFTFIITGLWYWQDYNEQNFLVAESFLFLFFAFYLITAVLYAFKQPPDLKGWIDSPLVFALPLVVFGLQFRLLNYAAESAAVSALIFGLIYGTSATALRRWADEKLRPLAYAFAALALIFLTLTLPLALSGRWASAAWAIEGVALIWIGVTQRRYLPRLGGLLISLAANIYFLLAMAERSAALWFNPLVLDSLLLTITNLFSAYYLHKNFPGKKPVEAAAAYGLFILGLLWWFTLGLQSAETYFPATAFYKALITLFAVFALIALLLRRVSGWAWLKIPALGLLPIMLGVAFLSTLVPVLDANAAFAPGWNWCAAFIAWYLILYREQPLPENYRGFAHLGALFLLVWLIGYEGVRNLPAHFSVTWAWCVWGLVPALFLLLIHFKADWLNRIYVDSKIIYQRYATGILILLLLAWVLLANLQLEGSAYPLRYFTLANPLDITSLLVLSVAALSFFQGRNALKSADLFDIKIAAVAFAVLVFIWANAALLRTLHFWFQVPWNFDDFYHSQLTQVVLSLFWSVIALAATIIGNQKKWRPLWLGGAGMISITVIKLFLVDMSNSNTLERIIAFTGVGLMLLLIGYFAPLPPKQQTTSFTSHR